MGGKGSSGNSPDVVYVVLERSGATDLLNALYIALGIVPKGGKESDGATLEGKGGGVKAETGSKSGTGKRESGSKGGSRSGGKPRGVKSGGSTKAGKNK